MNIKTQESYPSPEPWMAWEDDSYDGPGSALGHGTTEEEAIEDLIDQLIERGIIREIPEEQRCRLEDM